MATNLDSCKLCYSTKNLLRMFTGKCRSFRDMLRKMISETVHVKVEPSDTIQSICINCLIDVTNFYYFKLHCHQNQKAFKGSESVTHVTKKPRFRIIPLDEIELPDITATTHILDWLALKQADKRKAPNCRQDAKAKANVLESQESCINFKDQSCQTDSVNGFSESNSKTNGVLKGLHSQYESDLSKSFVDRSVQCKLLPTKIDKHTGNSSLRNIDKDCQTDLILQGAAAQRQNDRNMPDIRGKDPCSLSPKIAYLGDKKLEVESNFGDNRLSIHNIQSMSTPNNESDISSITSPLLEVMHRKSITVKICQYCDQSLYNRREISTHMKSHMWCHICRKRFRSINLAQVHINLCRVQQESKDFTEDNSAVYVHLVKVDSYPNFRTE